MRTRTNLQGFGTCCKLQTFRLLPEHSNCAAGWHAEKQACSALTWQFGANPQVAHAFPPNSSLLICLSHYLAWRALDILGILRLWRCSHYSHSRATSSYCYLTQKNQPQKRQTVRDPLAVELPTIWKSDSASSPGTALCYNPKQI